jgi:hypothetical protein
MQYIIDLKYVNGFCGSLFKTYDAHSISKQQRYYYTVCQVEVPRSSGARLDESPTPLTSSEILIPVTLSPSI